MLLQTMWEQRESTPWGAQHKSSSSGQAMKHMSRPVVVRKTEMLFGNPPPSECYHITHRTDPSVFLENPQEPTDQPLELIKELSKLTDYIISI